MINLIITEADGSPYWQMSFNSLDEAEAWYKSEQLRPYWKPGRIAEFVTVATPDPTEEEKAAKIAKQERIAALRDKHAAMKPTDIDTIVELRQAIFELHEIMGLK